jgi:hypothetical protein
VTAPTIRSGARRVGCPTCQAPVDQDCRNTITGQPLHRPAHEPRLLAAITAGHLAPLEEPPFPDEDREPE